MSSVPRNSMGVISVILYFGVAAYTWGSITWLSVLAGVLGVVRLVLLVKDWNKGRGAR